MKKSILNHWKRENLLLTMLNEQGEVLGSGSLPLQLLLTKTNVIKDKISVTNNRGQLLARVSLHMIYTKHEMEFE